MEHPDIDAWLNGLKERDDLDKLEVNAAKAWYKSLSRSQRHVFDLLQESHSGLAHLRRVYFAKIETQDEKYGKDEEEAR